MAQLFFNPPSITVFLILQALQVAMCVFAVILEFVRILQNAPKSSENAWVKFMYFLKVLKI